MILKSYLIDDDYGNGVILLTKIKYSALPVQDNKAMIITQTQEFALFK